MKKHAIFYPVLSVLLIITIVFSVKQSVLAQNNEYDIGKTHFDQKRYIQAISQWEKLLQNHPNYAEKSKVWFYLGLSNVELAKEYRTKNATQARKYGTDAMKYFSQILEQKDANGNPKSDDPFFPDTIFYMGQMFYVEGERHRQTGNLDLSKQSFDEAKQFFQQLSTQYPDSTRIPEALDRLGFMAICENNPTDAQKYYSEAIEKTIDPDLKSRCTFYNAWALAQLGNTTQAINIFNRYVLSRDPKYGPLSLYEIATINFNREEFQAVISRVNTMPQTFPDVKTTTDAALLDVWHDARVLQADAYEKLGQHDMAVNVIESVVLDLSKTGHPIAGKLLSDKIRLFNLFLAQKEFTRASNLYNNIEQTAGINTDEIKLLSAKLYDAQGGHAQALSILTDLLGVQTAYGTGNLQINTSPNMTGSTSLSEKSYYEACKLLAICYAKSGQPANVNAVLVFMYEQLQYSQYDYLSIAEEADLEVTNIASGYPGTTSTPFYGVSGSSTASGLWGQSLPSGTTQTSYNQLSPLVPDKQPTENTPSAPTKLTPREQQKELNRYINMVLAGKDKEAAPLLEQFFANDENSMSNRAVAGLKYGEVLLNQGYKEQAYDVFELVFNDYGATSESREAAYYLGLGAENDGDMKTARNHYLSAIQRENKQCDAALYRLATLELADSDEASGMTRLEEIYNNHRDGKYWSHAAWLLVHDIYHHSASPDIKRTEEILDEMLSNSPDTALLDRVLFLKGRIAQQQEHWETAALSYQTLIDLRLNSPLESEARLSLNECRDKITRK